MRGRLQFKSTKDRMTFWLFIVSVVPLLAVMATGYNQQVQSIKKEAFGKLTAIRDLKVRQVDNWIDERVGDIKSISADLEIRSVDQVFDKKEPSEADRKILRTANDLLSGYVKNYSAYHELFIVNPVTGRIEISTDKSSVGSDKSENAYFTEPRSTGDIYIQEIFYSKTFRKPSMTFSIPIFSLQSDEKVTGILVARIDLQASLYDLLLERTGMGNTGETLIVNRDAVALNELRWYQNAPLKLKIDAKPAVMASRGNIGITETTDYRGEEVLAAYTYITRTKWGFVSKQDQKEIYAPIRNLFQNALILFFITIVLVYVIAYFISRTIARPVLEMATVSKRLQAGDFTARNQESGADELGSLAESINYMAASIQSQMTIKEAGAEITRAVVAAYDMEDFGTILLNKLVEITDSQIGAFYLRSEAGDRFEPLASIGADPELLAPFDASILEGELGKALSTKKIARIQDIPDDTVFKFRTLVGTAIPKDIVTIPILVKNTVMSVISIASLSPYSSESLEILNQIQEVLNTAVSNLSANAETQKLAIELSAKNQELEAQSEELQSMNEELQTQTEELEEQNVELVAQRKQVEEANRLKSEFLSNMSHELRTPLNSVMALSRVLIMQAKDRLSEEEGHYLEIIERNGKQLLSLINDILDLSRIEAGKMDIHPKKFSVRSTLSVLVEGLMPLAEEKGIEIIERIPENLPEIESDESRVHQVLQNIIGNAVKFTEKGSVTVSARSDAERVYISVKDTGIGISKEDLSHIFEEFRQADGSLSRAYEGTGLGLTIAYKAAKMLGGEISVESEPGKGATFTFRLPIHWTGIPSFEETVAKINKIRKPGFGSVMVVDDNEIDRQEVKRILLVEDNEAAVIQVESALKAEGYDIDVVFNGREALDYVKHTIPDGIILDLMMPGVDGFEVLEKIRNTRETAQIPVLILTAKDLTAEDLKNLTANNILQLIQKGDVDREGLLLKVKMMLDPEEKVVLKPPAAKPDRSGFSIDPGSAKKRKNKDTPTVLIIENNPDNLTTIKAILQKRYDILEAADGEEGLKTAFEEKPDLILLDISLPGMDGYTVVRKIREDEEAGHIPVIGLTAHAMEGDREKIISAGCNDYISKPIDPEEILNKIGEWVLGTGD